MFNKKKKILYYNKLFLNKTYSKLITVLIDFLIDKINK